MTRPHGERLAHLEATQELALKRLATIETKLDTLLARPAGLSTAGTVSVSTIVHAFVVALRAIVPGLPGA